MRFLPPTISKKKPTIFWLDGHIPLFVCKSFVTDTIEWLTSVPGVLEQLDGDAGTMHYVVHGLTARRLRV